MRITQNVTLTNFTTMRLGGTAAYVTEATSREELKEADNWASLRQLPIIVIGGGSNIFWRDEGFKGLLVANKIKRFEVFNEDDQNTYLTIGAGEIWDEVVNRSVEAGLTGIECLSLVPGSTGATPIQNVGAYGQEIANTLVSVEAFDRQTKSFVNLPAEDCGFGYRTSRFKTTDKNRFLISAITLHLLKGNPEPPFYPAVENWLKQNNIQNYTPSVIRRGVIEIRKAKLPDPTVVANNGSFFANPVVDNVIAHRLLADYPELPHWSTGDSKVKLSAAWLIENAGFKDFHDSHTGMATWPKQPLVFVNENAKTTDDLLRFAEKIKAGVRTKFEVELDQEPELLP